MNPARPSRSQIIANLLMLAKFETQRAQRTQRKKSPYLPTVVIVK